MPKDPTMAEELVRQTIKEKSEEFRKTNRPLDKTCLKAIGFSEKGAEGFSSFMDSNSTHFSSLSRINLFLDKVFGPEGDISDFRFPFMGKIANNIPFERKYTKRRDGEKKKLNIINFTVPDNMKIWKEQETKEAIRIKKENGEMLTKLYFEFRSTFCYIYQYFSFLTPIIKKLEK